MSDNEQSNIQVELTDASEFHCFRLVLKPKAPQVSNCCAATLRVDGGSTPDGTRYHVCSECDHACDAITPRFEIMLHARALVDLIYQSSTALCEWQRQTTSELIQRLTGKTEEEARRAGWIA